MKLQASRPISPQKFAISNQQLATSRLGILHGRLATRSDGAQVLTGIIFPYSASVCPLTARIPFRRARLVGWLGKDIKNNQ